MKFIMKGIAAICAFVTVCTNAFATAPKIIYDYSNNRVNITGNSDKSVVLHVLKKGKTLNDLNNSAGDSEIFLYSRQLDSNDSENSTYSFEIRYADIDDETFEAGTYNAYMLDGTDEIVDFTLDLYTRYNYKSVIEKLNEYAKSDNLTEFKNTLEINKIMLDISNAPFEEISSENGFKPCLEYVKENNLDYLDSIKNKQTIYRFMIMQAISANNLNNADEYIEAAVGGMSGIYNDYQKYTTNSEDDGIVERQKYLTEKMSAVISENYKYEDFEIALKQGIILTCIRWANGYADVKDVLNKYGHAVGITKGASDGVYRSLCGNDYTANTLKQAFDERLSSNSSSGSGGSVGGGGGGNSNSSSIYTMEEIDDKPATKPVKLYFNDIDGVDWAIEAIIALADKGIISGKADGIFKPDDEVTREEFAKILVCAMGLENSQYNENIYADVNISDWFYPYVSIAYKYGIAKGVGEGKFGTGMFISRQDMAVMICNALELNESSLPDGNLVFEDSGEIADYAKQSVATLYEMGVVNGVSETEFNPTGKASRAQTAKMIYGVIDKLQEVR